MAGLTARTRNALIALVLGMALAIGAASGYAAWYLRSGRILPGVSIGGIRVGGMTRAEADWAVRPLLSGTGLGGLTLRYGDRSWNFGPHELGLRMSADFALDMAVAIGRRGPAFQRLRDGLHTLVRGRNLALSPKISPELAREQILAIARSIDKEAENAHFDPVSGELVEGKTGLSVNLEATIQEIMRAVARGEAAANLVVGEVAPRTTAADLRNIGPDVLARFETPIMTRDPNRLTNVKLAAKALNGSVVKPGQVFSFNSATGPREPQFGYLQAREIYRGQFVLGYGGGVCQVSSTLYNAALLANLEIVERYHHSRPLSYVPLGRDATVAYGWLDLKFRNSTPNPVLITAGVTGDGSIRVQILGVRTPDVQVAVVTRGEKSFKAPVEEVLSPDLMFGRRVVEDPGMPGYEVSVYRVIKTGREVREELISRDRYPAQPGKTIVGIGWPLGGDFFYLFSDDG